MASHAPGHYPQYVRRVLEASGLDRLVPVYPSVPAAMFGYLPGELAGQPVESFVPDGLRAGSRLAPGTAAVRRPFGDQRRT